MPSRIDKDHKDFIDVYAGRIRKELKKFINNGTLFRLRPDGKRIKVTTPKIDIPHLTHGSSDTGIGRGDVKKGDVIEKGQGKGNQGAGEGHQDGVEISLDLEDVLKFLQVELQLPNMKPKPSEIYQEIKIKYNDISKTGPDSLRHNKKTMFQALKRLCSTGEINNLYKIPGYKDPMKLITPIKDDLRYRKYKEIRLPSSKAVIFFARDGSASMDQDRCDIVSDMCWWIDVWIKRFYQRVETCYIWHDTEATEVSQNKFYRYRFGGGTLCSSAFKLISEQFENRFPPDMWNIYVFYFSDGDNWGDDNQLLCDTIKNNFGEEIVNLVSVTQIAPYYYDSSIRKYIDANLKMSNLVTTGIGENTAGGFSGKVNLTEEERNKQILDALKQILGKQEAKS